MESVGRALEGAYGAWVNTDGFTVGEMVEIVGIVSFSHHIQTDVFAIVLRYPYIRDGQAESLASALYLEQPALRFQGIYLPHFPHHSETHSALNS